MSPKKPARKTPAKGDANLSNADLSELMTTISDQLSEIIDRLESFGFAIPSNRSVPAKRRRRHTPGRPPVPRVETNHRYDVLRLYRKEREGGVGKKVFCENIGITVKYLNAILQMRRRHAKAERP